jgi:2-amino-4-hydroxy-6-hydroxymethyldihydropteridine diphosphokinase
MGILVSEHFAPAKSDETMSLRAYQAVTERKRAYLGLGGNLSRTGDALAAAAATLAARMSRGSALYVSAPAERYDQADFLNAALVLETDLEPRSLLAELKAIERELGRDPDGVRFGPRLIDLDILAIEGVCLDEPDLVIPHPRLHERRFALEPLAELAPDLKPWSACIGDPKQDLTVTEALAAVMDQRVERIAGPEWVERG